MDFRAGERGVSLLHLCFHRASTNSNYQQDSSPHQRDSYSHCRDSSCCRKTLSVLPKTVSAFQKTLSVFFWVQLSRMQVQLSHLSDELAHLVFKKEPSPSPLMRKLPVNKGSQAFPAGAKGMQNLHLSFTRHARRGTGPSPVMRG